MTEPRINLTKLQGDAEFVRSFIDGDSTQAGGFLDEFSSAVLVLVEAVEAAQAFVYRDVHGDVATSQKLWLTLVRVLGSFTNETTNPPSAPSAREPLAPPKSTPKEEA